MKNVIFFLASVPLWLFGQTDLPWKTLDNATYQIQYPGDWELDESGQRGTKFMIFAALEGKKDVFQENVNLLVQDLTGKGYDLDKYTTLSETQVKTLFTNATIIESKHLKKDKQTYHKIVYTAEMNKVMYQFEQYYFVVKDNTQAYVLTLTCEKPKFKQYQATGEQILNSFELK